MVKHLSLKEQERATILSQQKSYSITEVLTALNETRVKNGQEPLTRSPLYRFLTGRTHKRSASENRGRPKTLTRAHIQKLLKTRRRLIRKANSEHRVTYEDIIDAADLPVQCSQKIVEQALRKEGVKYSAPRKKIALTAQDAKRRLEVANVWAKRPRNFWTTKVHGFFDCKTFPMPLTPKQRSRFRQTRVTGHLRLASEGTDVGFTKPRDSHSWIGAPSVQIAAVVAKDRVIMWHEVGKKWNGAVAADMYKGPLIQALRRTWGRRRQYSLVEDGDRKGNQSRKGQAAKKEAGIKAMVLPPRTPCWMPLDYAIWQKIVDLLDESMPTGTESKASFLARLRSAAKSLPRNFVAESIGRMRKQILGVQEARGYHPKCD